MVKESGEIEGVSIVIPAYNEEQVIEKVLSDLLQAMAKSELPYEVIVVDDGSQDDTANIATRNDSITVLRHKSNQGYGAALKSGIQHAKYNLVCITDADGTYPDEFILPIIVELTEKKYDMVVGVRTGENVAIPLIRRPAKWAIGKLANYITNMKIPDINSGLRAFKISSVNPFMKILPNGFSFTTSITMGMLSGEYKVGFLPINYLQRIGKSKIKPVRDTINFVKLILRIGLYFAPLKIFLPLSFGLFLSAIGWGVFSKFILGELADVSALIIAMTSFQLAALALIAELINHRIPNYYKKD